MQDKGTADSGRAACSGRFGYRLLSAGDAAKGEEDRPDRMIDSTRVLASAIEWKSSAHVTAVIEI